MSLAAYLAAAIAATPACAHHHCQAVVNRGDDIECVGRPGRFTSWRDCLGRYGVVILPQSAFVLYGPVQVFTKPPRGVRP